MKHLLGAATLAIGMAVGMTSIAAAETCGGYYKVQRGESLSFIADKLYKNAGLWTSIHRANIGSIGENPNRVTPGTRLRLACIDGLPAGLEGGTTTITETEATKASEEIVARAPSQLIDASVNILTAGDFAPFTDRSLPGEGLVAELVHAAMQNTQAADRYKVNWVNDWSAHLDPLMTRGMMDLAFPWYKPDCEGSPENFRCANFEFSEPMFEMLVLLFADTSRPIPFTRDDDLLGRTLCRPAGYFTFDLDRADRRWLTEGKVTLRQPKSVRECFEMLTRGEVDAVALNEFTGRAAIKNLGLQGQVEVVQGRPLAIVGQHVLVYKGHPDADAMLAMVNGGLDAIKENGQYQDIVDRHMTRIWAEF